MSNAPIIKGISPSFAIPDAEIAVECEGFFARLGSDDGCYADDVKCGIVAAASRRLLVTLPEKLPGGETILRLVSGGESSNAIRIKVGSLEAEEMHIVANPAIDPTDDSMILTRSGSRGQRLPATLFRLEADGFLDNFPDAILNPTGMAFDRDGNLFVTNRAEGEIYQIGRDRSSTVYASGLGIATGLAFDGENRMYVGDRTGTIYRITGDGDREVFTVLEPSVSAYHLAFDKKNRLYITAPALASHDAVRVIDSEGFDDVFFRGLGRPQGMAFDSEGYLYVVGCYRGHHGVVRITPDGGSGEHFVAGNNLVGLCFTRKGELIVASNSDVYSIDCGIRGTLLN